LEEIHTADELSYTLDRCWAFPCSDRGGLLLIHFEPILANIHAQELNFGLVELALLWVAEQPSFPQVLEGILYSLDMVFLVLMMIKHVVKVVFKVLVEQWGKDLIHVLLEAQWSIGEAKSHHAETKGSVRSHERGLPFVSRSDLDLVVP